MLHGAGNHLVLYTLLDTYTDDEVVHDTTNSGPHGGVKCSKQVGEAQRTLHFGTMGKNIFFGPRNMVPMAYI